VVADGPEPGEVVSEYTIRGGRADADRLARQADVMAGATGRLLSEIGVGDGWACLDVGCGDGQVTAELARLAGASGRVVGVDTDAQALELARQATEGIGAPVTLVCRDIRGLEEVEQFDLAYARLVLSHLTDPAAALRAMHSALRPGGIAAVEDLFTGTLRSDPPEVALDQLQQVYSETVRRHGGDPTIGPRLAAMLAASDFEDVHESAVTNPMTTVDQKLFVVELLDNMRPAMVGAHAASAPELDEIRAGVERAARDPGSVFYQARIHQVWGRRPG
jgi:SAM-dependent methyltransferase